MLSSCGGDSNLGVAVKMVSPEVRSFKVSKEMSGNTENNPVALIVSSQSGYVNTVLKEIGQNVEEGEILAELVKAELMQYEEALKKELEGKRIVYDRFKKSHERTPELTPRNLVENARRNYEQVKVEYDKVRKTKKSIAVRATTSGMIIKRNVSIGEPVFGKDIPKKNTVLFEIQENKIIRFILPITNSMHTSIQTIDSVEVSFPELRNKKFKGIIVKNANRKDSIEVEVYNSNGEIRPGMYAKMSIPNEELKDVLSIESTSVFTKGDTSYIWLVKKGKAQKLLFEKGKSGEGYHEILNSNLKKGDQIVLEGSGKIISGMELKPL